MPARKNTFARVCPPGRALAKVTHSASEEICVSSRAPRRRDFLTSHEKKRIEDEAVRLAAFVTVIELKSFLEAAATRWRESE